MSGSHRPYFIEQYVYLNLEIIVQTVLVYLPNTTNHLGHEI
jgi:hypothetical protein